MNTHKIKKAVIYTDGACRGNPGPAAIGATINYDHKTKEISQYIGTKTNNQAEYIALIHALKLLYNDIITSSPHNPNPLNDINVTCCSDSKLVVNTMSNHWKAKHVNIKHLFNIASQLASHFKNIKFVYIPRHRNTAADNLANKAF